MKTQKVAMFDLMALGGCTIDYQQIVNQSFVEGTVKAFPAPAVRQGIDLIFPFNPDDDAPTIRAFTFLIRSTTLKCSARSRVIANLWTSLA